METSNQNDLQKRIDRWVSCQIKAKSKRHREEMESRPCFHYPNLDWDNFVKLLSSMANLYMERKGNQRRFLIDGNNQEVIRQMWLWTIASKDCAWDVNKGIYLGGKIGCGKTTLMNAFCDVLSFVSNRLFERLSAKDLYAYMQQNGRRSLAECPLFIDELGRESVEVTDFGNRIRPFVDVMELRYETGALTMITSNFMLSTLTKETDANGRQLQGYGEYICERVQEMTNMVVLQGGSRRQMWNKESAAKRP